VAISRAVDQGVGEWFDRKDDNGEKILDYGKPVRVRVHALTKDEERKARTAAFGARKSGKIQNETFVRAADRGEAHTRETAIAALEETENFNVDLAGNAKAEELFGKFPRTKAKHEKARESEVCFDGQWTPEVKRAYFSMFASSKWEAKAIADLANEVGSRSADDEAAATEDFSQP
jgi:hypothetical protein